MATSSMPLNWPSAEPTPVPHLVTKAPVEENFWIRLSVLFSET